MLTYALVVFAIGALGGLYLASHVLRGRLAPWLVSLLHALLGAIGLLLVVYAALTAGISHAAVTALIILIITALGGLQHYRSEIARIRSCRRRRHRLLDAAWRGGRHSLALT
jgi:predicted tellurium resistance membrane protein TerC